MVRSFNLSNYKNSIWRGKEYADLWYKKKKKKKIPYRWRGRWSDGGKAWLSSQIFLSPPSMTDWSSLSIILFLGYPFLFAAYVCFGFLFFLSGLGFYKTLLKWCTVRVFSLKVVYVLVFKVVFFPNMGTPP